MEQMGFSYFRFLSNNLYSLKIKTMNKIFLLLLLTFSINCFSQTQAEMNQKAYDIYDKADKKLNTVYQQILIKY